MREAIQALMDIGLKVTRDYMNKAMQKQVASKLPFTVLEVNVVTGMEEPKIFLH
jgi:hypothetical protein